MKKAKIAMTPAKALDEWRWDHRKSKGEMAEAIGISLSFYSEIIKVKKDPSVDTALRIEELTGIVFPILAKARKQVFSGRLEATG